MGSRKLFPLTSFFFLFRFTDIPAELKMALVLVITVVLFHVLDRQMEFTSRTDFLWKAKLKVEQEEVETMRGINKILLENILPAHVADHFLSSRVSQVTIYLYRYDLFMNSIDTMHGPQWTGYFTLILSKREIFELLSFRFRLTILVGLL